MEQFVYRDKQTGQTQEFDHEPSEAELFQRFGTAPEAPAAEGHSLARDLTTQVGLPTAGYIAGGARFGKPGAIGGAVAGAAAGDLYDTVADHATANTLNPFGPYSTDTSHLGPNAPPSMYDEVKKLLGVGTGAAVGAYGLPLLDKLPGPASLKSIGIGTAGGALTGQQFGHPGWGAAIGGAMGGYNLLRGVGGLAKYLVTPKFGPGAEGAIEGSVGTGTPPPKPLPGTVVQPEADLPPLSPNWRAGMNRSATGPKGTTPQANPAAASIPTRRSVEVPYQAPDDLPGGAYKQSPSSLETLLRVPKAELPGIGRSQMPNLSQTPSMRYGADITTPGDYVTRDVVQQSPTDPNFSWDDYRGRTMPVSGQPVRATPQTISIANTPEASTAPLSGQTNDLPNGGPKRPKVSTPNVRQEYPSGWKPGMDPSRWNELGGADADKVEKPDELARLKLLLRSILDANK